MTRSIVLLLLAELSLIAALPEKYSYWVEPCEHAEKEGVLLLVEPEPGLLIENADQFLELMQHFDSPALGLNFDIGHSYCVSEEPATTIPRLAKYLRHVHLEDIGSNRVHQHLTPGKGVIDFNAIFTALKQIHYQGWVTVELYPYETTAAGVAKLAWEHLQKIIAK